MQKLAEATADAIAVAAIETTTDVVKLDADTLQITTVEKFDLKQHVADLEAKRDAVIEHVANLQVQGDNYLNNLIPAAQQVVADLQKQIDALA